MAASRRGAAKRSPTKPFDPSLISVCLSLGRRLERSSPKAKENQNDQRNCTNRREQPNGKGNPPTHIAKVRHGYGKDARYEQIGVAWVNKKGGIYVKFYGTQVVSAFTLYEVKAKDETAE